MILQLLVKIKQKMTKKIKDYSRKRCFLAQKGPGTEPPKTTKIKKVTFSHKPIVLQLLVKFKQKMAKKSKTIAENGVFLAQKGPGTESPKTTKKAKITFSVNLHYLHF